MHRVPFPGTQAQSPAARHPRRQARQLQTGLQNARTSRSRLHAPSAKWDAAGRTLQFTERSSRGVPLEPMQSENGKARQARWLRRSRMLGRHVAPQLFLKA